MYPHEGENRLQVTVQKYRLEFAFCLFETSSRSVT
jgi:hypothetical protein